MSTLSRVLTLDPFVIRAAQIRSKTSKPIPDFGKTTYVYRNLPDRERNPEFEEKEYLPRRLSYWPPNLPQYRMKKPPAPWTDQAKIKEHLTLYPQDNDKPEWSESPNYPPLMKFDNESWNHHHRLARMEWYKKIRSLPTVEEKMYELAHNRRLYTIQLKPHHAAYNNLPITQNLTRTNLIYGLPSSMNAISNESCDMHVEVIKDHICDALNFHFSPEHVKTLQRNKRHDPKEFPKNLYAEVAKYENITYDLATLTTNYLTMHKPQLLKTQIDLYPSVKSCWFVGGMDIPNNHPRYSSMKLTKVNQPVFYDGYSVINMRNDTPIRPIVENMEDERVTTSNYNESTYHPKNSGYPLKLKRLSASAGFLPQSDDKDFPFLTFMSLHPLLVRAHHLNSGRLFGDEHEEIESMGIRNAFAWCNSIAFQHGFSPFDEITYPFTTQTILTDGQYWTFQIYQLNTHTFHTDLDYLEGHRKMRNICWSSGRMKLFERFDDNGRIDATKFNKDVLRLLIQFVSRETCREWLDQCHPLRPYLGDDLRTEEEKLFQQTELRRWQAQYLTAKERHMSKIHQNLDWEYVFGKLNPLAPDAVWLRRPEKFLERTRLDRTFFEHK